jgi:exonuclease III
MAARNCNILFWNVRGLNDGAKRATVRNQIISSGAMVVCLQETKISNWTHSGRHCGYWHGEQHCFSAISRSLWRHPYRDIGMFFFTLTQPYLSTNTVTAKLTMLAENKEWSISGVYGHQNDADKILFMQEILDLWQQVLPAWLLLGDFNLILSAQEKNNQSLNLQMINRFKATIDNLELARMSLEAKSTPGAMTSSCQLWQESIISLRPQIGWICSQELNY